MRWDDEMVRAHPFMPPPSPEIREEPYVPLSEIARRLDGSDKIEDVE